MERTRVLPILLAILCQLVFMRVPALAHIPSEKLLSTAQVSKALEAPAEHDSWRLDGKEAQSRCEVVTAGWNGAALSASKPAQQAKFSSPLRSLAASLLCTTADGATYSTLATLSQFNRWSGQPLWLLNRALLR